MLSKIVDLFRKPKPIVNNVLHLDRIKAAHFFNAAARAINAQRLTGRYRDRAENHAKVVWGKHLDRVPGYITQSDAEKAMRDYIDLQAKYQRNDVERLPIRQWSPKPVNGPEAAA